MQYWMAPMAMKRPPPPPFFMFSTDTMMGAPEDAGIVPRVASAIFAAAASLSGQTCRISASYIQVMEHMQRMEQPSLQWNNQFDKDPTQQKGLAVRLKMGVRPNTFALVFEYFPLIPLDM
jgi:hypothetical protein